MWTVESTVLARRVSASACQAGKERPAKTLIAQVVAMATGNVGHHHLTIQDLAVVRRAGQEQNARLP